MAGFLEVSSRRGRLFYLPTDNALSETPFAGYFRSRTTRPSSLCITLVLPDCGVSRTAASFDRQVSVLFGKLARSREQAKRFLRLSLSSNSSIPIQPIAIQPTEDPPSQRVEAGEMVFADSGRVSPGRRDRNNSVIGGPVSGMVSRPYLADGLRRASVQSINGESNISIVSLANEKPIASGNGVSISISLAEPVLYLQGFDQNDTTSRNTTMLRGSMLLKVTKQAKLKTISLNFKGKSETDWPEGEDFP